MNLQPTCKRILWSLAQRVSSIGVDYVETLNLTDWIVRRVAYAVDVPVPHVLPTIGALASAQRKRTSEVDVRGRPGGLAHAATWTAGGVRIMLYSKGAELENRRAFSGTTFNDDKFGRAGRSRLREAAQGAKNTIRFEVTYLSLEAIRRFLRLDSPTAPTFRLMARRDIGDYALGREIDRLRLGGLYCSSTDAEGVDHDGSQSKSSPGTSIVCAEAETSDYDPGKSRTLMSENSSIGARVGEQRDFRLIYDQFLAARATRAPELSITRLGKVMTTYLLMTAFSRRELLERGHKASSISKDLRDLDALGITMGDQQPSVDQQARVESFVSSLRQLLPRLRTDCPVFSKRDPHLVSTVPWAANDESLVFKDARADFNQEFSDILVEEEQDADDGVASQVLAAL